MLKLINVATSETFFYAAIVIFLPISTSTENCGITPKDDINVTQLPQVWYESFHSHKEILSKIISCQVITNVTPDADGNFEVRETNYYQSGKSPESFTISVVKSDETATYTGVGDSNYFKAASRLTLTKYNKDVLTGAVEIGTGKNKVVLVTDYSTYWIHVFCSSSFSGENILVNVYTSKPNPTASDLLRARIALIDLNVTVSLEMSVGCSKMK
uniref:uncharacterized protein LOC120334520 n=1 Tax=Styela clava TaxID=7725 RepID=UPI0019395765|nr:uncharacterized protein LOC120334520 [Styela clava]